MVKDYNLTETSFKNYAELIRRGTPDFIEIKGVTFAGDDVKSKDKDKMKMSNVPWHDEVVDFSQNILKYCGLSEDYELCCEHRHSLCILIAHRKFHMEVQDKDGVSEEEYVYEVNEETGARERVLKKKKAWHTWIDYEKFHDLVASGEWKNTDSTAYSLPTPSWALYGSQEAGFDPTEKRWHRKKKVEKAAALMGDTNKSGGDGDKKPTDYELEHNLQFKKMRADEGFTTWQPEQPWQEEDPTRAERWQKPHL